MRHSDGPLLICVKSSSLLPSNRVSCGDLEEIFRVAKDVVVVDVEFERMVLKCFRMIEVILGGLLLDLDLVMSVRELEFAAND